MPVKIDLLYKDVKDNYEVGTIDEFKVYLSDPSKRKAFFEEVIKPNYDVQSIDEFENTYGLKKKEPTSLSQPTSTTSSQPQDQTNPWQELEASTKNIPKSESETPSTLNSNPDFIKQDILAKESKQSLQREQDYYNPNTSIPSNLITTPALTPEEFKVKDIKLFQKGKITKETLNPILNPSINDLTSEEKKQLVDTKLVEGNVKTQEEVSAELANKIDTEERNTKLAQEDNGKLISDFEKEAAPDQVKFFSVPQNITKNIFTQEGEKDFVVPVNKYLYDLKETNPTLYNEYARIALGYRGKAFDASNRENVGTDDLSIQKLKQTLIREALLGDKDKKQSDLGVYVKRAGGGDAVNEYISLVQEANNINITADRFDQIRSQIASKYSPAQIDAITKTIELSRELSNANEKVDYANKYVTPLAHKQDVTQAAYDAVAQIFKNQFSGLDAAKTIYNTTIQSANGITQLLKKVDQNNSYGTLDLISDSFNEAAQNLSATTANRKLYDTEKGVDTGAILPLVASGLTSMYLLGKGGNALKGSLGYGAGTVTASFAMANNDYYQKARGKMSDRQATNFSIAAAGLTSMLELISPGESIWGKGGVTLNDALQRFAKGESFDSIVKPMLRELRDENIQELTQSGGDIVVGGLANTIVGKDAIDTEYKLNDFLETIVATTLATGLAGGFHGINAKGQERTELLNKLAGNGAIDIALSTIQRNVESGLITQDKANELTQELSTRNTQLNALPDDYNDAKKSAIIELQNQLIPFQKTEYGVDEKGNIIENKLSPPDQKAALEIQDKINKYSSLSNEFFDNLNKTPEQKVKEVAEGNAAPITSILEDDTKTPEQKASEIIPIKDAVDNGLNETSNGSELKYIEATGDEVQDVKLKDKEYKSELISPDAYLEETGGYESTFIDQKKVDAIKEKIKNNIPLDPLTLTSKEGTNVGQEGRHRAEAAKQLGITEIPVVRIEGELLTTEKTNIVPSINNLTNNTNGESNQEKSGSSQKAEGQNVLITPTPQTEVKKGATENVAPSLLIDGVENTDTILNDVVEELKSSNAEISKETIISNLDEKIKEAEDVLNSVPKNAKEEVQSLIEELKSSKDLLDGTEIKYEVKKQPIDVVPDNKQHTAGNSVIALDYLFTGGRNVILSTDYLLQALVGGFEKASKEIDDIRNKYASKLGNIRDDINSDAYKAAMQEIRDVINKKYNNPKAEEIFNKILENSTGFIPRLGNQVSSELEKLNEEPQPINQPENAIQEQSPTKIPGSKEAKGSEPKGMGEDNGLQTPTEQGKAKEEKVTPVKQDGFTEGKDLNKMFTDLKAKYGDKKGSALYDVGTRLVNPNKNTIVEIRSNGVVTKEGDKYTFNPFGNTDANSKKWTLYDGIDISDQYVKKEPVKNEPKVEPEETIITDTESFKRIIGKTLNNLTEKQIEEVAIIAEQLKNFVVKEFGLSEEQAWKATQGEIVKSYENIGEGATFKMVVNGETKTVRNIPDVVNGFYSPLEKTISESKQDKLPAKQWLDKFAKGEEAKWTGLTDWLKTQQGSVSKSDIQKFLKENRVQVVEVVKGGEGEILSYEKLPKEVQKIVDNHDSSGGNLDDGDVKAELYKIGYNIDFNLDGEPTNITKIGTEPTKYSQYVIPGEATNYREILVTMPSRSGYDKELKRLSSKYGVGNNYSEIRKSKATDAELEYLRSLEKGDNFKSNHWEEPNILTHIRMDNRMDSEGNKVLHISEIQSDWGQSGKKNGFKQSALESGEKYRQEIEKYEGGKVGQIYIKDTEVFYKDSSGELISTRINNNHPVMEETGVVDPRGLDYEMVNNAGSGIAGIPSAPFVTDTNSWVKIALKVAARQAVKDGAAKISWDTGEQQNDRYDLSKQVDSIEVTNSGEGIGYRVVAFRNGDAVFRQIATASELPSIIGKDLSQKIIDSKIPYEKTKIFKGVDLKIGGKGMKGFYGSPSEKSLGIVGNVAKSLFKQEPKTIELQTTSTGIASQDKVLRLRDWVQKNKNEDYSYNDAQKDIENNSKLYQEYQKNIPVQHSIDITPEIIAEVEEGLPLFQDKNKPLKLNQIIDYAKSIITGEKIFKRFSQAEQRGITEGGKIHAEASIILGSNEGANGQVESTNEEQEKAIEEYAKERGVWVNNVNEKYGQPDNGGEESIVWANAETKTVTKAQNTFLYNNLQEKLDSITLHNSLFPEASIKVIGFGRNTDGDFQVIIEQPFIVADENKKVIVPEIKELMANMGFDNTEDNNYSNSETIIEDLHTGNVILTPSGKLVVIDPIIRLNTPEQGYGGTRKISTDSFTYQQPSGNEAKGAANIREGKTFYDANKADVSTLVHEPHHHFLGLIDRLASEGNEKAIAMQRTVNQWVDTSEGEKFAKQEGLVNNSSVLRQEFFARSSEKYFMEGKRAGFGERMNRVFEAFKTYLGDIYKGVKNSPNKIKLSAEIRTLFDTIYGKEKTLRDLGPKEFTTKEALKEIRSKKLTHVLGAGMGTNQLVGTFISTEGRNRYADRGKPVLNVKATISNPLVVTNDSGLVGLRNETLQKEIDKFSDEDFEPGTNRKYPVTIEDLNTKGNNKLSGIVTENIKAEGYDSVYFPENPYQEGELVVFDINNVILGKKVSNRVANPINMDAMAQGKRIKKYLKENPSVSVLGKEQKPLAYFLRLVLEGKIVVTTESLKALVGKKNKSEIGERKWLTDSYQHNKGKEAKSIQGIAEMLQSALETDENLTGLVEDAIRDHFSKKDYFDTFRSMMDQVNGNNEKEMSPEEAEQWRKFYDMKEDEEKMLEQQEYDEALMFAIDQVANMELTISDEDLISIYNKYADENGNFDVDKAYEELPDNIFNNLIQFINEKSNNPTTPEQFSESPLGKNSTSSESKRDARQENEKGTLEKELDANIKTLTEYATSQQKKYDRLKKSIGDDIANRAEIQQGLFPSEKVTPEGKLFDEGPLNINVAEDVARAKLAEIQSDIKNTNDEIRRLENGRDAVIEADKQQIGIFKQEPSKPGKSLKEIMAQLKSIKDKYKEQNKAQKTTLEDILNEIMDFKLIRGEDVNVQGVDTYVEKIGELDNVEAYKKEFKQVLSLAAMTDLVSDYLASGGSIDNIARLLGDEKISLTNRALIASAIKGMAQAGLITKQVSDAIFTRYTKQLGTNISESLNALRGSEGSDAISPIQQSLIYAAIDQNLGSEMERLGKVLDEINNGVPQNDGSVKIFDNEELILSKQQIENLKAEVEKLRFQLTEATETKGEKLDRKRKKEAEGKFENVKERLKSKYGDGFLKNLSEQIEKISKKC